MVINVFIYTKTFAECQTVDAKSITCQVLLNKLLVQNTFNGM